MISTLKPFGVCLTSGHKGAHIDVLDITYLRELFMQHQLVLLRGFNTFKNADEFANYCENLGVVSLWPFGRVLELIEQDNPEDHIFDHSYVPMHWDGMYRPQIPEYQIFHCVQAPLSHQGGRTIFSNTMLVLENTPPKLRTLWHKAIGVYSRKMAFYDSKIASPVIMQHPYKDALVIRYGEPHSDEKGDFINPVNFEFTGLDDSELSTLHASLQEALYDPRYCYAHSWQAGDIVIADNFSLLHGREAFVSKAPRHIQRVHVLSDPPVDNPGLVFSQ